MSSGMSLWEDMMAVVVGWMVGMRDDVNETRR